MNNKEYLARMSPEQKQKHQVEGIVGIVNSYADQIKNGNIVVNPDSLYDNDDEFSFSYTRVN